MKFCYFDPGSMAACEDADVWLIWWLHTPERNSAERFAHLFRETHFLEFLALPGQGAGNQGDGVPSVSLRNSRTSRRISGVVNAGPECPAPWTVWNCAGTPAVLRAE